MIFINCSEVWQCCRVMGVVDLQTTMMHKGPSFHGGQIKKSYQRGPGFSVALHMMHRDESSPLTRDKERNGK